MEIVVIYKNGSQTRILQWQKLSIVEFMNKYIIDKDVITIKIIS